MTDDEARRLAENLAEGFISCSAWRESEAKGAPWIVEWVSEQEPAPTDLMERLLNQNISCGEAGFDISPIDMGTDWLTESYRQFEPFTVGPFFIHGSHHDGAVPDSLTGLQIDAASAFGSGEHPTTKTCLHAMLDLKAKGVCPWNVLDVGTGSGILAIAAWKLWKTPILATDNDAECIRVTERHAEMNSVKLSSTSLSTACGEGFEAQAIQQKKPYELVIANILAAPLIAMAADLAKTVDSNGYVILSGMLREQAGDVQARYESFGLQLRHRYDLGEWSTLLLHNPVAQV